MIPDCTLAYTKDIKELKDLLFIAKRQLKDLTSFVEEIDKRFTEIYPDEVNPNRWQETKYGRTGKV